MQRVRMKTHITGSRDGVDWPEVGGELDVPDHEAADLATNGYADIVGPVDEAPAEESARPRGRRGRKGAKDEASASDAGGSGTEAGGPDDSPAGKETDPAGEPGESASG